MEQKYRHLLYGHGSAASYKKEFKRLVDHDKLNLALALAAGCGDVDNIKILAQNGANIHSALQGMTPLHWAAKYGRVDAIHALLRLGADPDLTSDMYNVPNPLWMAVKYRHFYAVEALVEKTRLDADFQGNTVLGISITYAGPEILQLLLRNDTSQVNTPMPAQGMLSPLQLTLKQQADPVVMTNTLIESGAKVDIKTTAKNLSPMKMAMLGDHMQSIHVLTHKGASMAEELKKDPELLNNLIQKNCRQVIRTLLEQNKIIINPSNDNYKTPLYVAVQYGRIDLIRTFIRAGARVTDSILGLANSIQNIDIFSALGENPAPQKTEDKPRSGNSSMFNCYYIFQAAPKSQATNPKANLAPQSQHMGEEAIGEESAKTEVRPLTYSPFG